VVVVIVLGDVRLDALAAGLGSSGGAICMMMFEARRKLRTQETRSRSSP
jgi:hypothetical protein